MKAYKPPRQKRPWDRERTMISIKKTTKTEIEKIGHMKDTYDDVLLRLVKFWNEHHKN